MCIIDKLGYKSEHKFTTLTSDLLLLRESLLDMGVRQVAMESTSIYWIFIWRLLFVECLRADFYEEMVAYGKDVYGIDLSWRQVANRLHSRDNYLYGVVPMCRLPGVSKQAYYKHVDRWSVT